MYHILLKEFLEITKLLNKINITPTLMGSVGLEYATDESWNPNDLDIHVPGNPLGWEAPDEDRIYNFEEIERVMEAVGYSLINKHEHEFKKDTISVEFGCIDTLPEFAGVPLNELKKETIDGAEFFILSPNQFLKLYEASAKDGYRNDNNNSKDFEKIEFLKQHIRSVDS